MESIKVVSRSENKESNKSLLKKDLIPGIIYGKGTEPTKISCDAKILNKLTQSKGFYTKILKIKINDKDEMVLPKELQFHPVNDKLIHFDFLRIQEDTKVNVEVPVEFLNMEKCPGLKKGGVLNTVRRTVELICNAKNIPEKLIFDLVESEIGDAVKISNIKLNEGVIPVIKDRDFVIATLVPPTVEAEPEKKEDEATEEGADKEAVTEETKSGEAKTPDNKTAETKTNDTKSPEKKS